MRITKAERTGNNMTIETFSALTDSIGVTNLGLGGRDPRITALANGGWVVTWAADNIDASGKAVMIRVYDALGRSIGPEVQVNQTEVGEQFAPIVVARDDGGFDVLWYYETEGRYLRSYAPDGTALGGEVDLGLGFSPTLTALPGGGFMEIFRTTVFTGQSLQPVVRIKVLNAGYGDTGTNVQINQAVPDGVTDLAITTLGNGNIVALWADNGGGAGSGTFGRILTPQGGFVSNEFQVDTFDEGRQIEPRVTALTGGGFVVTWKSGYGQDGSDWGQFAQIFADDGTKVGPEFQVNTLTQGIQYQGTPVALADGGFVIVYLAGTTDTLNESAVLAQRFDASGTMIGDAIVVAAINASTANEFFTEPYATALAGGGFAVTWWGGNTPDMIYTKAYLPSVIGTAASERIDGTSARETIDAGDGADTILAAGEDDTVVGGGGADDIDGGSDDDCLVGDGAILGTSSGEIIDGTAGGETIIALAGDDTINGGAGDDTMLGGQGADVFLFAAGYGRDMIVDFEDGLDVIYSAIPLNDLILTDTASGLEISHSGAPGDTLLLLGISAHQIDGSDIIFVD